MSVNTKPDEAEKFQFFFFFLKTPQGQLNGALAVNCSSDPCACDACIPHRGTEVFSFFFFKPSELKQTNSCKIGSLQVH